MTPSMGRRIAQARHEAGFDTAEALAREIGVSGSAVRKWEVDEHNPRRPHLEKIAELTDKPISFFYGEQQADVQDALRRVQELMEGQSITEIQRDGSTREMAVAHLPEIVAGTADRGVIAVPKSLLPTDVPSDRLVACYADSHAPDLREGDIVLADTETDGWGDGTVVVAEVDGEVVVREAYDAGNVRLLVGTGGATARVRPDAILARVVTALHVRHYEDADTDR